MSAKKVSEVPPPAPRAVLLGSAHSRARGYQRDRNRDAARSAKAAAAERATAVSPRGRLRAVDPYDVAVLTVNVDLHIAQTLDELVDVFGPQIGEVDRYAVL